MGIEKTVYSLPLSSIEVVFSPPGAPYVAAYVGCPQVCVARSAPFTEATFEQLDQRLRAVLTVNGCTAEFYELQNSGAVAPILEWVAECLLTPNGPKEDYGINEEDGIQC